jgi:hypothetical protein
MRGVPQIAMNASGNSIWIPLDTYQTPPAITLAVLFSEDAALTGASVQYVPDDIGPGAPPRSILFSQTTTVITVTDSGPVLKSAFGAGDKTFGHGLLTGDWYKIFGTGLAGVDAEYSVASTPTPNSLTLTSALSQSLGSQQATAIGGRVFTHATLTGLTARATGNFLFPVKAARLSVTGLTAGTVFLEVLQGGLSS